MLTLVVLVLGVVLASTTQVAADVEAQLLCAVESIGTEGGASCGEPSEGTGSEDDDDVVDPPSFAAQQSYYVTTEDGRVYQMELGGGGQLDPSLGDTGSQLDPSLGGPDERGADCDPVRG